MARSSSTTSVTTTDAAMKLKNDFAKSGLTLTGGRVHVTSRKRPNGMVTDFMYIYEDGQGKCMKFMSRKSLVAYVKKQQEANQKSDSNNNHKTDVKVDILNDWMDKKIEDNIAEMEQKRATHKWIPSTSELSKTYTHIVMETLSRKEEIKKLMTSPLLSVSVFP